MDKPFWSYHLDNPHIWKAFENFTLKTIEKGFKHYSAKGIFEIIRWHSGVKANKDPYKVNNNYTAHYARKFMEEYPQHAGFFRTRIRRTS